MRSYLINWCRIIILFLTCLTSLFINQSYAWGRTGHQITAEIASSIISHRVKQNVQQYLGSTLFEEASVWMDEMRSQGQYEYMKPWHYINIEKGEKYIPGNGDNIIDRLNLTYKELQYRQHLTDEQIHDDLLLLFHLVGDLFQPLHVGYGADRGGNTDQVNVNGRGTNLHAIWDTYIIDEEHITRNDCMELYRQLSASEINHIRNASFVELMYENRKLLADIYPSSHKIEDNYLQKNKIIVERQLLYGGIKLAAVLEQLFSHPDNRVAVKQEPLIKIRAEDAAKYIGKRVTVCSQVYGVKELANINFINLGGQFPDNPLTLVVFSSDKRDFKQGLEIYNGKKVCVTGIVKEHRGKLEIIINTPEEISIK